MMAMCLGVFVAAMFLSKSDLLLFVWNEFDRWIFRYSHKNAWLTVRKGRAQCILAIIASTFARVIGTDYVLLV